MGADGGVETYQRFPKVEAAGIKRTFGVATR
jgi:hypothetical protein